MMNTVLKIHLSFFSLVDIMLKMLYDFIKFIISKLLNLNPLKYLFNLIIHPKINYMNTETNLILKYENFEIKNEKLFL